MLISFLNNRKPIFLILYTFLQEYSKYYYFVRTVEGKSYPIHCRVDKMTNTVQELLDVLDVKSDHIAIRTSYYKGIGEHKEKVEVFGLNYMVKKLKSEDSLLIVDDVHDTGMSIDQIIFDIKEVCKKNTPQIKIATPYFKPTNNKTKRIPDFYLHKTDQWLVFPHELEGLTKEEIKENKPQLAKLIDKINPLL